MKRNMLKLYNKDVKKEVRDGEREKRERRERKEMLTIRFEAFCSLCLASKLSLW